MESTHSDPAQGPALATPEDLFTAALRGGNTARAPVWLMRQAGRYMSEYRALREKHSFKELCDTPDLAVEVSLLPHRLIDADALIVFYDILIPLEKMGAPLTYEGGGPVFTEAVRDEAGVERLHAIDPARDTSSILEAIRRLREEFRGRKAVLGFAGAPFTLASYLVEGRLGQGIETLKRLLFERPDFVRALLDRLTDMTIAYLRAQAEAGASAVQLFDTWAGHLGPAEYREFALPCQRRIFEALGKRGHRPVPAILYVRDASHLLEDMAESGADALSIEWRVPLDEARRRVGPGLALQGNLDPCALFAPVEEVRRRVREILESRRGDPAFIFNLGHGVLPRTPIESVRALVETVQGFEP